MEHKSYDGRVLVNNIREVALFCKKYPVDTPCYALEHDVLFSLKRAGYSNSLEMPYDYSDSLSIVDDYISLKEEYEIDDTYFYIFKTQWLIKKYGNKEIEAMTSNSHRATLKRFFALLIAFIDNIFVRWFLSRKKNLTLDFTSISGQSSNLPDNYFNVRYIYKGAAKISKSTFYRFIIKEKKDRYKHIVIYYDAINSLDRNADLKSRMSHQKHIRELFYAATKAMISKIHPSIQKIKINEGLSLRANAALKVAAEYEIFTELRSHGGVVPASDTGAEHQMAHLLSSNGFNSHPLADILYPRSAWQMVGIHKPFKASPKFTPRAAKPLNSQFTILFAPNYHRFAALVPGYSPTSFDVAHFAEVLSTLAAHLDFKLGIRLKFSPTGKARSKNDSFHSIDPPTIEQICSLPNVYKAERDITTELENADLTITCGNTAMLFDSLELGVPVAIIRRNVNQFSFVTPPLEAGVLSDGSVTMLYADDGLEDQIRTIKSRWR